MSPTKCALQPPARMKWPPQRRCLRPPLKRVLQWREGVRRTWKLGARSVASYQSSSMMWEELKPARLRRAVWPRGAMIPSGWARGRRGAGGGEFAVVVAIVAEQYDVDGRQGVKILARGVGAARAEEAEGAGAGGPHGVGEEVTHARLEQVSGVVDPGGGEGAVAVLGAAGAGMARE